MEVDESPRLTPKEGGMEKVVVEGEGVKLELEVELKPKKGLA